MRGERGQASTEWTGVVLLVVLVLGALGAGLGLRPGRAPASGRELGDALAERFTCAARGACGGARVRRRPLRLSLRPPGWLAAA